MENRDIRWQRLTGEQALRQLRSSASGGLGRKEARLRLRRMGENRLFAGGRVPYAPLRMLLTDPSLLLFAAVCLLTVCFGELALGLPALAVYAAWFCLMLGLALRMRADRDRLQERRVVRVCVIRDGRARRMSARALVPGDVLLLRAGDVVPADCLLLESDRLRTRLVLPPVQGERPGVLVQDKSAGRVYAFGDETLPPEFENIVYGGAEVLQGSARAVVFATGARSFYGAMGRTLLPEPLSGQSALLAGVRPYLRLSGFALLALMLPLCVAGLLLSPDTQSTLRVFLPLCALAASGTAAVPCLLFSALLREPGGAVPAARTSRGADRLPGVTDLIVMGPDGLTDGRWQFRGACNGAQTFAPGEEHSGLQPLCEAVALLLRARERLPASGMPEGERLAPLLPELVRLSGYDTAALAVRLVGLDRESNGPACRLRVRTREEAFRLCFVPDASPLAGCVAYETPSGRPAPLEPGMRERLHRFVRQAAARGEMLLTVTKEKNGLTLLVGCLVSGVCVLPGVGETLRGLSAHGVRVRVFLPGEGRASLACAAQCGAAEAEVCLASAVPDPGQGGDAVWYAGYSRREVAGLVRALRKQGRCAAVLSDTPEDAELLSAASLRLCCDAASGDGDGLPKGRAAGGADAAAGASGQDGPGIAGQPAFCPQVLLRDADLVLPDAGRPAGGLCALLPLLCRAREAVVRVRFLLKLLAGFAVFRTVLTLLCVLTGAGTVTAYAFLYASMGVDVAAFVLALRVRVAPERLLRHRPLNGGAVAACLRSRRVWLIPAASAAALVLLLTVLRLTGLMPEQSVPAMLFCAMLLMQGMLFLFNRDADGVTLPAARVCVGVLLSLVLPVLTAAVLSALLPAVAAVTELGAWSLSSAVLLALSPFLVLLCTLLLSRYSEPAG